MISSRSTTAETVALRPPSRESQLALAAELSKRPQCPFAWAKDLVMKTPPAFNTPEYWQAYKAGVIPEEQVLADYAAFDRRRNTARRTSHRYAFKGLGHRHFSRETGAYVPMKSAQCINRNLTGCAKDVLDFILEKAYLHCREERAIYITKSYIAGGIRYCQRAVQYALRQLEDHKYIICEVVRDWRGTVHCLRIKINEKTALPKHHWDQWPTRSVPATETAVEYELASTGKTYQWRMERVVQKAGDLYLRNNIKRRKLLALGTLASMTCEKCRNLGEQKNSYNKSRNIILEPARVWAKRCMEGIYKSHRQSSLRSGAGSPQALNTT